MAKVIKKVRHDHTYARAPSQAPAEHHNSISFNNPETYLRLQFTFPTKCYDSKGSRSKYK